MSERGSPRIDLADFMMTTTLRDDEFAFRDLWSRLAEHITRAMLRRLEHAIGDYLGGR